MSSSGIKEASDKLLRINLDAYEGYKTASRNANDSKITTFFDQAALQRKEFAEYWASHLDNPSYNTDLKADLHRVWIDLKNARQKYDATSILRECQRGEKHALKAYEKLEEDEISGEAGNKLEIQKREIESKLDQIRIMIDEFERRDFERNNDTPVA